MTTTQTHDWITKLLTEANEFDEALFPPMQPVGKDETVFGEAPLVARKYFALACYYRRECERLKVEGKYQALSHDEQQRYLEMDDKDDFLMECVWSIIHAETKDWDRNVGIRIEWKIVRTKPENPGQKLAALLGLGLEPPQ